MKYLLLLFLSVNLVSNSSQAHQWQGHWSSSFGPIKFIELSIKPENATLVFGSYGKSGSLTGVSIKGVLYGEFYDQETKKSGKIKFTLDESTAFFKGEWKYFDKDKLLSWNGSLSNHEKPKDMRSIDRFRSIEGHWESNFGPLDLIQNGVFVNGKYSNKGELFAVYNQENKLLYGLFTNKKKYGLLRFPLNQDKTSFDGQWSWKTQNWAEQKWTGSKK